MPSDREQLPAPGLDGSTATNGQIPVWNNTTKSWEPGSNAAGAALGTNAAEVQTLRADGASASTGGSTFAAALDHAHAMPRLDQALAPTAAVAMNAQKVTGLANGTAPTDAAAYEQIGQGAPRPSDDAYLAWNYPYTMRGTSASMVAANLYFLRLRLDEAAPVSKIVVTLEVLGVTLTSGQSFVGIYKVVGTKLVLQEKSADLSSELEKAAAKGFTFKPLVLLAPIALAAGLYYVALLVGGGTTMPKLGIPNSGGLTINPQQEAPYTVSKYNTTVTALPAEVALTSTAALTNGFNFWVALA